MLKHAIGEVAVGQQMPDAVLERGGAPAEGAGDDLVDMRDNYREQEINKHQSNRDIERRSKHRRSPLSGRPEISGLVNAPSKNEASAVPRFWRAKCTVLR